MSSMRRYPGSRGLHAGRLYRYHQRSRRRALRPRCLRRLRKPITRRSSFGRSRSPMARLVLQVPQLRHRAPRRVHGKVSQRILSFFYTSATPGPLTLSLTTTSSSRFESAVAKEFIVSVDSFARRNSEIEDSFDRGSVETSRRA